MNDGDKFVSYENMRIESRLEESQNKIKNVIIQTYMNGQIECFAFGFIVKRKC